MRITIDPCDTTTVYADLRDDERLTAETRARAIKRARELGAKHVEFWRSPYGDGPDRMAGFIELGRITREFESRDEEASERVGDNGKSGSSTKYAAVDGAVVPNARVGGRR